MIASSVRTSGSQIATIRVPANALTCSVPTSPPVGCGPLVVSGTAMLSRSEPANTVATSRAKVTVASASACPDSQSTRACGWAVRDGVWTRIRWPRAAAARATRPLIAPAPIRPTVTVPGSRRGSGSSISSALTTKRAIWRALTSGVLTTVMPWEAAQSRSIAASEVPRRTIRSPL